MTQQYDAIAIGAGVSGRKNRSISLASESALLAAAQGLLINDMQDSWFFGSTNPENVRGRFLLFAGGVPLYREIFADVAAKGYEGFELS